MKGLEIFSLFIILYNAYEYLAEEQQSYGKDFVEIVKNFNYEVKTHEVITSDDYHLTLFEMPGNCKKSKNICKDNDKLPIFLMHGLYGSSTHWVLGEEVIPVGTILLWLSKERNCCRFN